MADRIKGITVEIGGDTTGLSKALSGVNKEISGTQRNLKDVERLLKMDPGNTELLRQKYELLNQEVDQTDDKLKALKDAEKQVQAQFQRGEVGKDKYDALKREIIETETNLGKLRSEAQKAENAVKGIDEKPVDEVADAAKEAEGALENAGEEASNFGDYLKAGALVEGAKGIVSGIKDMAEESKEYRGVMASLEVSSQKAGYTAEDTAESYRKLYGVLADDQTAATTTANLQALGLSQQQLDRLIDSTIGAWATYGDSIPIDGLAESINETVRAGQVTGTFADVLNWGSKEGETFGVTLKENTEANEEWNNAVKEAKTAEDYFNLALQGANSEAERSNIVMQAMANQGLSDAGKAWQQNNQSLVESNQSSADFQAQIAKLGETIEPVITQITAAITNLLSWFNGLDSNTQALILTAIALIAAIGPIVGIIQGITTAVGGLSSAFSFLAANPIVLVIAAIVALIAAIALFGDEIKAALQSVDNFLQDVFATDFVEIFGPVLGGALNGFFGVIKGVWDGIKQILDGIIDFIGGVFSGDWERAWEGVKGIFSGIWDTLVSIAKAPINGIIWLINKAIDGINWIIDGINSISFDLPDWLGGGHIGFDIGKIGNIPYLAKGGVLSRGTAVVGEAGPELLTVAGGKAVVQPLTRQTSNTTNMGGVTFYVYGAPGQDVNELTDAIMDRMETVYQTKGAAWR